MVEVNGVGFEDVGAAGCRRVDVLVEFPGVEWGVVIVADDERDCIGGRRLEADSPAHQVLRDGCLCVLIEMESSSSGAASVGPAAAASAAGCSDVGVIVAIVAGRHCRYSAGDMSSGVDFV